MVGLAKIALVLFLGLVVAPRALPPLVEAFGDRLTESLTPTAEEQQTPAPPPPAPATPATGD